MSGDVHFSEISRSNCNLGYPIYEFTTSGLTHSCNTEVPLLCNALRHSFFADRYRLTAPSYPEVATSYAAKQNRTFTGMSPDYFYGDPNFGMIQIDWEIGALSFQTRSIADGSIAMEGIIVFL